MSMIGDKTSVFEWSTLPTPFGVVLLILALIFLLSPYFSGADFGVFKIPIFTPAAKRWLKVIGPIVFCLCVAIFLPIISKQQPSTGNSNTALSNTPSSPSSVTAVSPCTAALPPIDPNPETVRNRFGMEFVLIPPGEFCMGSENGLANARPVHRVTIPRPFYLGKTEVTQEQWSSIMGQSSNPSHFRGRPNLPVEEVSWDDAQVFINKLNQLRDGFEYRLPTEAEWEYACRSGSTAEVQDDLDAKAWYWNNSFDTFWQAQPNGRGTHAVASKLPNKFGLYDMNGNVWEWCRDADHPNYDGAPTGASAWVAGSRLNLRALRGGSWGSDIDHGLRYAYRNFIAPGSGHNENAVGFRVAAARTG